MNQIDKNLIAPCGIDCAVCRAYLREKNHCPGCQFEGEGKPKSCESCKLKLCNERKSKFCDCDSLPCKQLAHLDLRYRTKYKVSPIENLKIIKGQGIGKFLEMEEIKWVKDKGVLCMHNKKVYPAN